MQIDEDSVQLHIDLPQEEKAKIVSVIDTYELFHIIEDNECLKFFLSISHVYLKNLIARKEQPKIPQEVRKSLNLSTILWQRVSFEWPSHDGHHTNYTTIKGNISLSYPPYKSLIVSLFLGELEIALSDYIWARVEYYSEKDGEWKYKNYNLSKSGSGTHTFEVEEKDIQNLTRGNLAIEISVQKEIEHEREYLGIKNQGNTCYMNSILQVLYYLRPLRKIILDSRSESKVIKVLKEIFIELLDVRAEQHIRHSVDAEQLITAFGRFAQYPRRQQDIHEFMLGFLEELENECPELKQLWLGTGKYNLVSKEADKPYASTINDQFSEIDIHMEDPRGNTFRSMGDSLKVLLEEQKVQDKIDTEEHGKVTVGKNRQFTTLPNVVFFNVKRYEFKKERNIVRKILANLEYPQQINLGFLLHTPGDEDHDYVLYAVTVHKGQAYNSGHYYSIVNTSSNRYRSHWCQFNDSFVRKSSLEQALSFSGGKKHTIILNKQYGRFVQKEYSSEQTAYLLAYIRKNKFEQYQQVQTTIPREWVNKRLAKKAQREQTKTQQVEVCVFNDRDSQKFDPFNKTDTVTIPVNSEEELAQQLKKIERTYLGCRIGTIWKVSKETLRIKNLLEFQDLVITAGRIFDLKRGHRIPSYILVFPEQKQIFNGENSMEHHFGGKSLKLGIIKVTELVYHNDQPKERSSYHLVNKGYLDQFVSMMESQREKKGILQQKESFLYDWNDFCTLQFD